jgi:DNA repair protein RadA/Sms
MGGRLPGVRGDFICSRCQGHSPRWIAFCPECNAYETLRRAPEQPKGVSIAQVSAAAGPALARLSTGISDVDKVLGGGIVLGSVLLLGGEPGMGKSTLLLWVAELMARAGHPTLYIAGEESAEQVAARGARIGAKHPDLKILRTIDAIEVGKEMQGARPKVTFIDSLQTMVHPEWGYPAGSPTQLKVSSAHLCGKAKKTGSALWFVGHVDKQGNLQGPNTIMHMVDCVLYLEGDPNQKERFLLGVKNRWGATDPVATLEMRPDGLKEAAPQEPPRRARKGKP